jgi:DNA-binding ferritin-like protein
MRIKVSPLKRGHAAPPELNVPGGQFRALPQDQELPLACERSVAAGDMMRELMNDNRAVAAATRKAYKLCDEHEDVATASLLETCIDAAEKRTWFLFEPARAADKSGH